MEEAGFTGLIDRARTDESVCALVSEGIRAAGLWGVPGAGSNGFRTHLIAPEPFPLTSEQFDTLHKLGPALASFYAAVNDLYLKRRFDWVNDYLDRGKPDDLLRHAAMHYNKRALPRVIRPDILITNDGLVITELDSVPGGMGHLDCLSAAYESAGFELIGSHRGMRDGFAAILRNAAQSADPVCGIIVSDESEDYRPEMKYLAGELSRAGIRALELHPRDVEFTEDGLFADVDGAKLRLDVVYRFFELFDLLNIPKSELISYAARKKLVAITPPYKPHLEEKLLMALLHSDSLTGFWREAVGEENFELLRRLVAPTYVFDNRLAPPHAEISGFCWRGGPIRDWRAIRDATQKERRLVIKPSGFSPLAWGSRGVVVGQDVSQDDWSAAVDRALGDFDRSPWVLQPFREPSISRVKYFDGACGAMSEMESRVRLCPYYFSIEGGIKLGGVMATACPKDKKLIHGMVDAIIAPCRV